MADNQAVLGIKGQVTKSMQVDALAHWADEGRGKLRKATVSRTQALTRRYPNGATRYLEEVSPHTE